MDTTGDADELADDEDVPEEAAPLLTVEGRAIAGAGLVLGAAMAALVVISIIFGYAFGPGTDVTF